MKEPRDVGGGAAPSGTVTFLFSDIEGSTRRWVRHRAAMQDAVRLHDRLMRSAITAQGGRVFKTVGDEFCAAFPTPEGAVAAALDAQRAIKDGDFSAVDGLRVRMALATGTTDERDGDYFGPTVNRVARILALAHGGQILLSSIAAGLMRENLPPRATLSDLGKHALKDFEGQERVYQLVALDLLQAFPPLRSEESQGTWLVPDAMRTQYFTGREGLLTALHQELAEKHRAALSGLGGIGKTQTAIEYAVRHRAEYPNGVFWVSAETISGLTGGFVAIAHALLLAAARTHNHEQILAAVLKWLNANDRWLLIFDNVDERREVQPFVPNRGAGHLLITSREPVLPELGVPRALQMPDLDNADALRLLCSRTGKEDLEADERVAASELATELGNLPLALDQAAAYIAETMTTFSAYLGAFRKRRLAVLEKSGRGAVAHDTVAVTWAANFEAVECDSPAAAEVLRISALLAPDAIPFELFLGGARAMAGPIAEALTDADDLAMAEVLRPLARYSLIRPDAVSRTFGVHRLVQEIVWAAVPEEERQGFIKRVVSALDLTFPESEYAAWALCERLMPHVASMTRWLESFGVQSEAAGRVLNTAGWYLWERGRYSEARALYERALSMTERVMGSDHPDVARSLNNLANVHWFQGCYDEAQALNERALAIRERALGPDHPDVARSLNTLGLVYREQGRYAEALALLQRALAIRERAFGQDHPYVAHSLSNIANVLCDQGRYAEAQPLYERAFSIRERVLGEDHPDIAASLNNLASVSADQGRHAEALRLYERALEIAERTLGKNHSDVALNLNNIAEIYVSLGRYADAEPMFVRALEIRKRVLGPDHSSVADSLSGLASAYVKLGRYAEAERLLENAREIQESVVDSKHQEVAETLTVLATLRKAQGRNPEAVALLEQALTIKERTFSPNHPELIELRSAIDSLHCRPEAGMGS